MQEILQSPIKDDAIKDLIRRSLEEDLHDGDVTTRAIIDKKSGAKARWVAKEDGTIAGLDVAEAVFRELDPEIRWEPKVDAGQQVEQGTVIVEMEGLCRALLSAERTALNFAQRMSGIATRTRQLVSLIEDYDTKILDTRKTIPGLRMLDKQAVKTGGGKNHRMGLFDMAMIKDNHIVAAGGITKAVERVRKYKPEVEIEVETTKLEQVDEALAAGADIIMLDNMAPAMMEKAVLQIKSQAKTEASGNITAKNIVRKAKTGVDFISLGALTHSVNAFDISQQLVTIT